METSHRRPLKTRGLEASRKLARAVAATGISPNAISVIGLGFAALAGLLFASTSWSPGPSPWAWAAGAIFVQLRLLANMLDGMVAEDTGKKSPLGEFFNEIPDRLADVFILLGLGFARESDPFLGIAAAGLALFTAYLRVFRAAVGAGHDFGGPLAKPQRMFLVTLGALACAANGAWVTNDGGSPSLHDLPILVLGALVVGTAWTALGRLWRLLAVLRQSKAGSFLPAGVVDYSNTCTSSAVSGSVPAGVTPDR